MSLSWYSRKRTRRNEGLTEPDEQTFTSISPRLRLARSSLRCISRVGTSRFWRWISRRMTCWKRYVSILCGCYAKSWCDGRCHGTARCFDKADLQQQDNQAALDLEYVQLNVAKVR